MKTFNLIGGIGWLFMAHDCGAKNNGIVFGVLIPLAMVAVAWLIFELGKIKN